jgi:hypothetical protein
MFVYLHLTNILDSFTVFNVTKSDSHVLFGLMIGGCEWLLAAFYC